MIKKYFPVIFMIGTLLVLCGAMMYAINSLYLIAPYIFTAGAVIVAVCQYFIPCMKTTLSLRRLHRQQLLGGALLVAAGIVMLVHPIGNYWILCLTVAAILELYTAFRIPQLEKKEKEKKDA